MRPSSHQRHLALQRLEKVRAGIDAGKSFRQIAREIGCDEGTIRRDHKKLCLPVLMQHQIASGAACGPLLRVHKKLHDSLAERQALLAAARERQRQLLAEKLYGSISTRLCDSILAFLAEYPLHPNQRFAVVAAIEPRCWFTGFLPEESRVADYEQAIESTRPNTVSRDPAALVTQLTLWLLRWVVVAEPNRDIRDRALVNAKRHLEQSYRL